MTKISLSEATRLVPVSKSTLYRDATERKFSWEKDQKGRKVVDPAELERFYGKLNSVPPFSDSNGNSQQDQMGQNGNDKVTPLLEQKIEFLESQLNDAKKREDESRREKEKLLGIVEKQTLMLEYHPEKPEKQEKAKKRPDLLLNPWVVYGVAVGSAIIFSLIIIRYVPEYLFGWLLP